MSTPEILAAEFTAQLGCILTCREWHEMLRRNRAEVDPLICHSHDFCDANEVMESAFIAVTGRYPGLQNESDCALWSAAWAIAKSSWQNEIPA